MQAEDLARKRACAAQAPALQRELAVEILARSARAAARELFDKQAAKQAARAVRLQYSDWWSRVRERRRWAASRTASRASDSDLDTEKSQCADAAPAVNPSVRRTRPSRTTPQST